MHFQDFPAHKESIEEMIDSYDNQMPRSVSDAFSRLQGMLEDSNLPQEVIDAIIRYVEEEIKQSSASKVYDNKMNLIDMKGKSILFGIK